MSDRITNVAIVLGRDRFDRNVSDEQLAAAAIEAADAVKPARKRKEDLNPAMAKALGRPADGSDAQ